MLMPVQPDLSAITKYEKTKTLKKPGSMSAGKLMLTSSCASFQSDLHFLASVTVSVFKDLG